MHATFTKQSSPLGNARVCQGSMGLHQNNFKPDQPLKAFICEKEKTIVEVFRNFRDQCMLKLKDGFITSTGPAVSSKAANSAREEAEVSTSDDNDSQDVNESLKLDDLPFYCKIIILSKLETIDICHLSVTSRHWREVCSDQVLWRELLYRDMIKWHSIGHKSYPLKSLQEFFQSHKGTWSYKDGDIECTEDAVPFAAFDSYQRLCEMIDTNFKALYFHTAYQRHKDIQFICMSSLSNISKEGATTDIEDELTIPSSQQLSSNQSFPRFLRNLWLRIRSGNGEVIMLGPGMESRNTSKIFKRLLWTRPDLLITQRLLPGSQDGVGSGVELDFKGEKRFNLIALYSGSNRDRTKRNGLERLQHSNILDEIVSEISTEQESFENALPCESSKESSHQCFSPKLKFKLTEPVFNFLQNREESYRLIYVVDATKDQPPSIVSYNRLEISAILDGIRCSENAKLTTEVQSGQDHARNSTEPTSTLSSIMGFTGVSVGSAVGARRPLLVLSCVQDKTVARIPCIEIALLLDLASIRDRPWHVQDVTVDQLTGIESGLDWLFKQM